MQIRFIVMSVALLLCSLVYGQSVNLNAGKPAGSKYDTHLVVQGETLYSLSKRYHTTVADLLELNPAIIDNNLPAGQEIRVPILPENMESSETKKQDHAKPIIYTVQKKETLYSISKRNNTNVETLMLWNNLQEPSISEGQDLIVGYETPEMKIVGPLSVTSSAPEPKKAAPESDETENSALHQAATNPVTGAEIDESGDGNDAASVAIPLSEKGIATWVKSSSEEESFYALHPSAPKGTEITVKNMMNGKTVVVKVIGKLPATSANENVLIKISGAAAKKLGVLDERFLAELSYRGMQEEDGEASGSEENKSINH